MFQNQAWKAIHDEYSVNFENDSSISMWLLISLSYF